MEFHLFSSCCQMLVRRFGILSLWAVTGSCAFGQGYQWINPSGGVWEHAANWSRPTFPSSLAHNVNIVTEGSYEIWASTPLAVRSLNIPNPNAHVIFGPGSRLDLGTGPFAWDGTVEFRDLGTPSGSTTVLNATADITLDGSGQLLLTNALPGRYTRIGSDSGRTLIIGEDFTMRGAFGIGEGIENHGAIVGQASGTTKPFFSRDLVQGETGRIIADGCTISLRSTIYGGTLATANDGAFEVTSIAQGGYGEATLDGVALAGRLAVQKSSVLHLFDDNYNNATISLGAPPGTNQSNGRMHMYGTASLLGTGVVELMPSPNTTYFAAVVMGSTSIGVPSVIGHGQVIRGSGLITGYLNLDGIVVSDIPDRIVMIRGSVVTSAGRIGAEASTLVLAQSHIRGGEIFTADGGVVIDGSSYGYSGGVELTDVRLDGRVETTDAELHGVFTNDGVLSASRRIDADLIVGDGLIELTHPTSSLDAVEIGSGQEIRGQGEVLVLKTSHARLFATIPATILRVSSGPRAAYGDFVGQIAAAGGAIGLDGASVRGAVLSTKDGGEIVVFDDINRLTDVTLKADTRIRAAQGSLELAGSFTLEGDATISAAPSTPLTITAQPGAFLLGNATLRLEAGDEPRDLAIRTIPGTTLDLPQTIGLHGSARLDGNFQVHGAVTPAGPNPVVEHTRGTLALASSATLQLSVGPGPSARLDGHANTILLGGTLIVDHTIPSLIRTGDAWELITGQTIAGSFDSVVLPTAPTGIRMDLTTTSRSVILTALCAADFTGDGLLNFLDVSAFLSGLQSQSPAADLAEPFGVWNFFDISAFLGAYGTGCP